MYKSGITAAQERLDECKQRLLKSIEAANKLQSCGPNLKVKTFPEFQEIKKNWTEFTNLANQFFSKLEQGAKASDKSKNWYGRIKHLRRTDELLQYIHQVRHASEHSLDPILNVRQTVKLPAGAKMFMQHTKDGSDNKIEGKIDNPNRGMIDISIQLEVCRVYNNKYNDRFEPPETHKGIKLNTKDPVHLMSIITETLENVISEARNLEII